jgi:tetratricopeptide (TPR) repeat protein
MTELTSPDLIHLNAAEGWLGLGDWASANEELDQITPEMRAHPDVLEVRWQVYAAAKRWEQCVEIAEATIKLVPNSAQAWIHRSFALHELGRPGAAFDYLLPAAKLFPKEWLIPYNLACYCAQIGRLDECEGWFKKAMAMDEDSVKRAALDDPDLKPLWDSMGGMIWKRKG